MPELDAAFFALADPTRRAILARLTRGERSALELAAPFEISQPAVSRHLRVLEEAGLIQRRVDGSRRPCRIDPERLAEVGEWLNMLRQAFSANYGRLDRILDELADSDGETR